MDHEGSTPLPLTWHVEPEPVAYPDALAEMSAQIAAMRAGQAGERVWLLEHPPLYTAGTSARPADLAQPQQLPVFATGRGGQWTYHGPGQRVAYVMLDLERRHGSLPARDLHAYVAALESWLVATLACFGIAGERRTGRVGVWVKDAAGGDSKIAAVGVRITRWVSWHGVSLNVCPDLSHFGGIVPCGIREHGVTSLCALGVDATMAEVDAALRRCFYQVFSVSERVGGPKPTLLG
jgi:lipoyl(octanoyl) transferase